MIGYLKPNDLYLKVIKRDLVVMFEQAGEQTSCALTGPYTQGGAIAGLHQLDTTFTSCTFASNGLVG
jgi:hypothetical protein